MTDDFTNQKPDDLTGLNVAAAKEYILSHITTLKLTNKEIQSLENEAAKWKNRVELARTRGIEGLLLEAEKEVEKINQKLITLREEERDLRNQIDRMRGQIPALAARERSIDPLLLEQELLMALGKTEEEVKTDKAFRELEKDEKADIALEALKAKIKGDIS